MSLHSQRCERASGYLEFIYNDDTLLGYIADGTSNPPTYYGVADGFYLSAPSVLKLKETMIPYLENKVARGE
jgi:hypothetical protein